MLPLERTLVLDGGLAEQLLAEGCALDGALWTAGALLDAPERVRAAHAAYARAGAQVLLTASYQASFAGFAARGADRARAAELFASSVALARSAAREVAEPTGARPAWVAASVGPYGAVRADGGEYRGRYGLSVAELARFHRPRVEALAAAGPDVLALETVPDVVEAEALLRAARGCGVPVWLSYTVAGGRTRAGQPLAEAFAVAAGEDQVLAVGVNCCAPPEVADAVALAAEVAGKPVVAYPNSGETFDPVRRRWRGPVTFAPRLAVAWRRAGARLIGGCCRVGPDRVRELARVLRGTG